MDQRNSPQRGQDVHAARRARCGRRRKFLPGAPVWRFVWHHLIAMRWSPEQIAATLGAMHPDEPALRVSHETIHGMHQTQPRGGLKAAMILALPKGADLTRIAPLTDTRPRKTLNWKTPAQDLAEDLKAFTTNDAFNP